jgi:hypothetical protein
VKSSQYERLLRRSLQRDSTASMFTHAEDAMATADAVVVVMVVTETADAEITIMKADAAVATKTVVAVTNRR